MVLLYWACFSKLTIRLVRFAIQHRITVSSGRCTNRFLNFYHFIFPAGSDSIVVIYFLYFFNNIVNARHQSNFDAISLKIQTDFDKNKNYERVDFEYYFSPRNSISQYFIQNFILLVILVFLLR